MTMPSTATSVAILGAGKLGTVLAQLALKAGYTVFIAGSGAPEKIHLSMSVLVPGATVTTSQLAVERADIVILALPLSNYRSLAADIFAGKLVVDAMNYWWEVDGDDKDLISPNISTSELVQQHLSGARVVKALSHMGYHHLHDEARPAGHSDRKAIAIAGDTSDDVAAVGDLVNRLGFDPVPIGDLASGKQLEPGHAAFGANVTAELLRSYIRSE